MENVEKGSGAERRGSQRVYASFVEYCRVEDATSRKYQAFTENISVSGICIFVNEDVPVGACLSITVYLLDGSSPIEAKGRVIWTQPSVFLNIKDRVHFDVGIEFIELAEKDKSRLRQYAVRHVEETPPSRKRQRQEEGIA